MEYHHPNGYWLDHIASISSDRSDGRWSHIFVRPLSSTMVACQSVIMRFMKAIRRLLFVTALLGIIVGPLSIGAADSVMASSGAAAMGDMSGMDTSGDMPCCPDEMPIKPDCGSKSCPLALVCTTVIVGQSATECGWSFRLGWVANRFLLKRHAELASSLVNPPARPPKV